MPTVVKPNGKLKDKVRVKGAVGVHPKDQHTWSGEKNLSANGSRSKREQTLERTEVFDRAHKKSLEVEARAARSSGCFAGAR